MPTFLIPKITLSLARTGDGLKLDGRGKANVQHMLTL